MKMKKSDGGGGGANWMDTYGDMVTLLLCFFVLLYSMSTVDENKWKALVQSFNPKAIVTPTETPDDGGPNADPVSEPESSMPDVDMAALQAQQEEVDNALEELYTQLMQYIQDSGKNIEVTKGDGVVYVNFDDTVFFDGEEYTIKPEGEETLNVVCGVLDKALNYIDEVRVLGHTAQATLDRPNNVTVDRRLSSNRATETVIYIQEHCQIEPARLISEGYGQWRPVTSNDDAHRARNRRVEMMISGKDLMSQLGDSIEQYDNLVQGKAQDTSSASPAGSQAESGAESQEEGSAGQASSEGQERGSDNG